MKVITKIDGIDLLKMIANDELECGTMIRHKREDLTRISNTTEEFRIDNVYEYYKYTAGDKRFHRCNENGKLGAKGQKRFLNYSTLNKTFEIVEIEEEKSFTGYKMYTNGREVLSVGMDNDENPLDDGYELFEDKDIEEITIFEHNNSIQTSKGAWTARNLDKAFAYKINELVKEVNKLKNK